MSISVYPPPPRHSDGSPLDRTLFHCKVCPLLQYSFIHLGGGRHFEDKVSFLRTQCNDSKHSCNDPRSSTLNIRPPCLNIYVQCTNTVLFFCFLSQVNPMKLIRDRNLLVFLDCISYTFSFTEELTKSSSASCGRSTKK